MGVLDLHTHHILLGVLDVYFSFFLPSQSDIRLGVFLQSAATGSKVVRGYAIGPIGDDWVCGAHFRRIVAPLAQLLGSCFVSALLCPLGRAS